MSIVASRSSIGPSTISTSRGGARCSMLNRARSVGVDGCLRCAPSRLRVQRALDAVHRVAQRVHRPPRSPHRLWSERPLHSPPRVHRPSYPPSNKHPRKEAHVQIVAVAVVEVKPTIDFTCLSCAGCRSRQSLACGDDGDRTWGSARIEGWSGARAVSAERTEAGRPGRSPAVWLGACSMGSRFWRWGWFGGRCRFR